MLKIWGILCALLRLFYSASTLWRALRSGLPRYSDDDVHITDVRAGTVLYLPQYGEVLRRYSKRTGRLPKRCFHRHDHSELLSTDHYGMFDHPILVVSRRAATPNNVDFLLMRSFRNTPIHKIFKGDRIWGSVCFLLADPSPPYPLAKVSPGHQTLTFKRPTPTTSLVMPRVSYVDVTKIYTMNIDDAAMYFDRRAEKRMTYELDGPSILRVLEPLRKGSNAYHPGRQARVTILSCLAAAMKRSVRRSRRQRWFRTLELAFMLLFSQLSLMIGVVVVAWLVLAEVQDVLVHLDHTRPSCQRWLDAITNGLRADRHGTIVGLGPAWFVPPTAAPRHA
ncbi:hypothetical protein LTR56_013749 [Elasticomyces elasticus]|nr:hypothetical protein LTR22_022828 [Elasticomyces elasticus]KAK3637214.1 hypothetical protein LTR56_013749 [Elasticomyces elasticus]KAK4907565.1 hypothetical protein LTR49_023432 [Elasticomyces elasticus]